MRQIGQIVIFIFLLVLVTWGGQTQAITLSRNDVDSVESSSVRIEPTDVVQEADLDAYALSLMRSDKRVQSVDFRPDAVEVRYREEGRLLALVPINFTDRVLARADGSVELEHPWFGPITIDNQDETETLLRVAVNTVLARSSLGTVRAEGEAKIAELTPQEKAKIAGAIEAVLAARNGP